MTSCGTVDCCDGKNVLNFFAGVLILLKLANWQPFWISIAM